MSEAAQSAPQAAWPWPDALDALIAAPKYHRLLLENSRVCVLEVRIPVGETVPVHTHRWPSVVQLLQQSHFVRRDGVGCVLFDSRLVGDRPKETGVEWLGPLPPHSVENVGSAEIILISVELKEPTSG